MAGVFPLDSDGFPRSISLYLGFFGIVCCLGIVCSSICVFG